MAKPPLSIPDSELDVIKVLWERGRATVREVLETLKAAGHVGEKEGRPWSYATVATLVDKLYQGEPGLLILHLLKSHQLDPNHAHEDRALLEEMKRPEPPTTSSS